MEIDRGFHLASGLTKEMKSGDKINLNVVLYLVQRAMEKQNYSPEQPIVLDGFPFTLEQFEVFERTIGHVKLIIHLDATANIICSRNIGEDEKISRRKHLVYTKAVNSLEQSLSGDPRYKVVDASLPIEQTAEISTMLYYKLDVKNSSELDAEDSNLIAITTNGLDTENLIN
jgi:adenylate kinase family enzyme